jgi:TatD DNase family protein
MELIDTHAHIYLPEFQEDLEMVLQRAGEAGVSTVIMPAIDASTHGQMLKVQEVHANCLSMIGLHPCSVNLEYEGELEIVNGLLSQKPFKAIGEIGLDFYWDKTFADQQYEAFHKQIEIAATHDLPIVIHSRSAIDECIAVVREHPGTRGVFHCFSGNEQQGRQIMDLGFYLGIGGVVSFKNAGLDKVLPLLGLSQVVLETDAPYLAPVPYRGKRNEPAYTKLVAEKLAIVMGISLEEVAKITTSNAKKLFSLGEGGGE